MNARGIPAQSEPENLEPEYSYTVNEMTGEKVPYGQEAKNPTAPPSGDQASAARATDTGEEQQKGESKQQRQQQRRDEKKPE